MQDYSRSENLNCCHNYLNYYSESLSCSDCLSLNFDYLNLKNCFGCLSLNCFGCLSYLNLAPDYLNYSENLKNCFDCLNYFENLKNLKNYFDYSNCLMLLLLELGTM